MTKLAFTKCALSATAFAIALAGGAGSAMASSPTLCTISSVSADNAASPMRFSVWCNGDFSTAYTIGYTNCPVNNTDLQKLWQSLIMSAFLSGKKVNIWFDSTTCGIPAITSVQILG